MPPFSFLILFVFPVFFLISLLECLCFVWPFQLSLSLSLPLLMCVYICVHKCLYVHEHGHTYVLICNELRGQPWVSFLKHYTSLKDLFMFLNLCTCMPMCILEEVRGECWAPLGWNDMWLSTTQYEY